MSNTSQVKDRLRDLIDAVCLSDEFRRFEAAKERIDGCADEKRVVDDFRRKAYQLSNYTQTEDMPDEIRLLAKERAQIRKDPVVAEYLTSEMELCRMLQGICAEVLSVIDLQLDDFIDFIEA